VTTQTRTTRTTVKSIGASRHLLTHLRKHDKVTHMRRIDENTRDVDEVDVSLCVCVC
jgi:hypothetical protein